MMAVMKATKFSKTNNASLLPPFVFPLRRLRKSYFLRPESRLRLNRGRFGLGVWVTPPDDWGFLCGSEIEKFVEGDGEEEGLEGLV